MNDVKRIKRLIAYYRLLFDTSDPIKIADRLGILYQFGNCKFAGCYMFLKNHRYIFLSNELIEAEAKLVMAHELGHAILDRKENCYFRGLIGICCMSDGALGGTGGGAVGNGRV